ncbi:MAG: 23S rRNA (pseudouridine(1915)-N(3))-methyltransferase RlmH [Clostridia bacterium]|nr:23S rRNA (pseudouridine(1915)-N(3))-methyltransferase RlmH [Clostridia bacterium]
MLSIKIVCVGKIKEKALKELCNEYLKRLSKYAKMEIIELEDEKLPQNLNDAEIQKIKQIESNKLKEKLIKIGKSTIFFLDLKGKEYSSDAFSKKIEDLTTYGTSTLVFVIGGSLGMTDELLNTSENKICFSSMTFPHQLIRVFLLEQLFRAFKMINHETYHH